jgi:hypothetical protein
MTSAFDEPRHPQVSLEVSPDELASIIEALHDGVLRRIRWTSYADQGFEKWKKLDLEIVQQVINGMFSAYTKGVMTYRDADFTNRASFEDAFLWPDEVFDLLYGILDAESWDSVPNHRVHKPAECKVCYTVFGN